MRTFIILFALFVIVDIICSVLYYRYHNYVADYNLGKTSNDEVSVLDVSF